MQLPRVVVEKQDGAAGVGWVQEERGCENSQAPCGERGEVAMPPVGQKDSGQCGVLSVAACETK